MTLRNVIVSIGTVFMAASYSSAVCKGAALVWQKGHPDVVIGSGDSGDLPRHISNTGLVLGQFIDDGFLEVTKIIDAVSMDVLYSSSNSDAFFGLHINDDGVAVGYYSRAGLLVPAYVQHGSSSSTQIPGTSSGAAYAINNVGQIVGASRANQPWLWSGGIMSALNIAIPGAIGYIPAAINDKGQIVGVAYRAEGGSHAFLYSNGVTYDLTAFAPRFQEAMDINNSSQIVGSGFLLNFNAANPSASVLIDLGPQMSYTKAVNNHGQVVGSGAVGNRNVSYLWDNGLYTEINFTPPPGYFNWGNVTAFDINDSGVVVALADFPKPVPEPSTWAFSVLGLGLLVWRLRRRAWMP